MTLPHPLFVVGEVQSLEEQRVDRIAEEHLRQRVLPIGVSKKLIDRLVRDGEKLIASEAGFEFFDLLFDPGQVSLARDRCGRAH